MCQQVLHNLETMHLFSVFQSVFVEWHSHLQIIHHRVVLLKETKFSDEFGKVMKL